MGWESVGWNENVHFHGIFHIKNFTLNQLWNILSMTVTRLLQLKSHLTSNWHFQTKKKRKERDSKMRQLKASTRMSSKKTEEICKLERVEVEVEEEKWATRESLSLFSHLFSLGNFTMNIWYGKVERKALSLCVMGVFTSKPRQ